MIYSEPSKRGHYLDLVARSGLPCFLEKPLALTPSEANALEQRLPRRTQLGHFLRYWPALIELATSIQRGVIGEPSSFRLQFTHQGESAGWFDDDFEWMRVPAEGGGGFFDLAVHCVDALISLGQQVDEVVAWTPTSPHQGIAELLLRSGATATIEAGWSASSMTICVEATGPNGTLTAEGGELRHGGDVVSTGPAPTAESAIDRWLDVCLELATEAELVPIADAVSTVNVLAALRKLDGMTDRHT
jgi:predicted dehydrogenase